jgi:hypothetical protein
MLDLIKQIQTKDMRDELVEQVSGAIAAAKAGTPDWKSRVKAALDFVKDATGFFADVPGAINTIKDTLAMAYMAYMAVPVALPVLSSVFP